MSEFDLYGTAKYFLLTSSERSKAFGISYVQRRCQIRLSDASTLIDYLHSAGKILKVGEYKYKFK